MIVIGQRHDFLRTTHYYEIASTYDMFHTPGT